MNVLYVALGVFAGIYVGAIPGLSVTMATSILIAMTFSWDTNAALALMIGVYVGGVYGGSRSAIMLNIPGAPAAVATTFDGYPLAKKGEAGKAIAVSTLTSVVGGLVGLLALWLAAPIVSKFALSFSPRDYFLLTTMGLLLVGSMGVSSVPKGLFAATAGLMLGVVGMDPISGLGRLTFGNVELRGGLNYIAIMIGLFGIGEALYQIRYRKKPVVRQEVDSIRPPKKKLLKLLPLSLRSGLIGTAVGALPGAGGEIAALLSYDAAKRTVKNPETPFGEGAYEGVVAPESANN
ncbi:MAG: tripartite tricarboxylate transporter permease, partial [Oscillospiraceae bacterium]